MSQRETILRHLSAYETITPAEAYRRYGIMRLAARINELRDSGYSIVTRAQTRGGKRYAEYRLAS